MNKNNSFELFTPPHILSGMSLDTPILLGLSGGADSVTLLHMLVGYCRGTGAPLYTAHVNHMIRGEDAERDRDFCEALAAEYGVPCFVLEADVPAAAKERGIGLEEAARQMRYDFFDGLMLRHSIPLLATAHNADDALETLIFNISRGCGLQGLGSIPPVRQFGGGLLIRPLLKAPKADILRYCEQNSLSFVTDATNADDTYSRNHIRHNIIPALKKLNGAVLKNTARLSESARLDADFMARQVNSYLEGNDPMSLSSLRALHPALLTRVLARLYSDYSGGLSVEQVHLSALITLIERGVGNSALSLPGLIRAQIRSGRLEFVPDPRKSFRHL